LRRPWRCSRLQPPELDAPVGGIVDVVHDSSPSSTPPHPQSYINCGWGHGRFQGHPRGRLDLRSCVGKGAAVIRSPNPFNSDRFITGRLIDEAAHPGKSHTDDADPLYSLRSARRKRVRLRRDIDLARPALERATRLGANICSFATIPRACHVERWRHAQGCGSVQSRAAIRSPHGHTLRVLDHRFPPPRMTASRLSAPLASTRSIAAPVFPVTAAP